MLSGSGKRPGWACRELVFLLSGEEWSGATVEEVARILRAAGYEVGEPVRD
jgi:hypothetical protein